MSLHPYLLVGLPLSPPATDCACPDHGYAFAQASPPTDGTWQISLGMHRDLLPDDHELFVTPHEGGSIIVLNETARAVLEAFEHPRPLTTAPHRHPVALDDFAGIAQRLAVRGLLTPAGPRATPARPKLRTLTTWLHVTNACNLSCAYCYVPKTAEAMDKEVGQRAIEATLRSALAHGFEVVKLKYAGGEATLNFGLIRELHGHAVGRSRELGLELQACVLSNGVALTRQMILFLNEARIGLMISLDGVGAANDRQRPFLNGAGSYTQVVRAIERAIAGGLHPELSVTVSARNAESLAAVAQFALDYDLRLNFNFYRESKLTAGLTDLRADEERLIRGVHAALDVIASHLPARRLLDGLIDRSAFNTPHEHACGAGHSYLVVDQRGRIAACQMHLDEPLTSVDEPDPLGVIKLAPAHFAAVPASQREGCTICTWRPWCAGGCPALTVRITGRNDVRSPYCRVYTAIYPRAVQLEGLRLLRWAEMLNQSCDPYERFA